MAKGEKHDSPDVAQRILEAACAATGCLYDVKFLVERGRGAVTKILLDEYGTVSRTELKREQDNSAAMGRLLATLIVSINRKLDPECAADIFVGMDGDLAKHQRMIEAERELDNLRFSLRSITNAIRNPTHALAAIGEEAFDLWNAVHERSVAHAKELADAKKSDIAAQTVALGASAVLEAVELRSQLLEQQNIDRDAVMEASSELLTIFNDALRTSVIRWRKANGEDVSEFCVCHKTVAGKVCPVHPTCGGCGLAHPDEKSCIDAQNEAYPSQFHAVPEDIEGTSETADDTKIVDLTKRADCGCEIVRLNHNDVFIAHTMDCKDICVRCKKSPCDCIESEYRS